MTSREWQADRRAVLERDEYTCRHCGTTARGRDPTGVRVYPIDTVPLESTVHRSFLVTVCDECFELLRASDEDEERGPVTSSTLFAEVRECTETQGETISKAASFASLVTELPERIEAGEELTYVEPRGDLLLSLAVVDAHLERLDSTGRSTLDGSADEALSTFLERANALQETLERLVDLSETVVAGLDCCHVCFAELDGSASRCSTCSTEPLGITDWRTDGDVDFRGLFSTLNETLREATTATDAVTEGATTLAERLSARE